MKRPPRNSRIARWLIAAIVLSVWHVPAARAQEDDAKPPLLDPYGDLRLRMEQDWDSRWGTSTQARLTNMKGSEFRVLFTITPSQNIFARLFFVDAIDLLQPGDTFL
jgi:hypothetical protein